eukprot:Sspe_Gene.57835::Locus_31736_Transcript_1_1_Confidence_1.000_Length_799::g.57835::m.57835
MLEISYPTPRTLFVQSVLRGAPSDDSLDSDSFFDSEPEDAEEPAWVSVRTDPLNESKDSSSPSSSPDSGKKGLLGSIAPSALEPAASPIKRVFSSQPSGPVKTRTGHLMGRKVSPLRRSASYDQKMPSRNSLQPAVAPPARTPALSPQRNTHKNSWSARFTRPPPSSPPATSLRASGRPRRGSTSTVSPSPSPVVSRRSSASASPNLPRRRYKA